jgi:hypothetical protein
MSEGSQKPVGAPKVVQPTVDIVDATTEAEGSVRRRSVLPSEPSTLSSAICAVAVVVFFARRM